MVIRKQYLLITLGTSPTTSNPQPCLLLALGADTFALLTSGKGRENTFLLTRKKPTDFPEMGLLSHCNSTQQYLQST